MTNFHIRVYENRRRPARRRYRAVTTAIHTGIETGRSNGDFYGPTEKSATKKARRWVKQQQDREARNTEELVHEEER